MKSAILRAKIPVYYSEGFNPHPKMVFALPLSVGAESICEYLDIKIVEDMSNEEIKERLNFALPENMSVLKVSKPDMKFNDIKWSEYRLEFDAEADTSALDSDRIVVEKKTKSGVKEVDIKTMIKSFSLSGSVIDVVLSADSENYLNPEYIVSLIPQKCNSILRVNVYNKNMKIFC